MEPDRTQIKLDPRYTADLLEVLKTNFSIPSACFSLAPTAAQLLRASFWMSSPQCIDFPNNRMWSVWIRRQTRACAWTKLSLVSEQMTTAGVSREALQLLWGLCQ
uniref:Uncharacterized protein n=1 Tax=Felis catus TaxID=9685 RepID=A0ABI7XFS9_FELCA